MAPILVQISPDIMGALTGSMLSDGHIAFPYRGALNARFRLTQSTANLPLVEFCHNLLGEWTNARIIPWPNVSLPQHAGKTVIQYSFVTRSMSLFTALHNLWYRWDSLKGKWVRILPANLGELLTPIALAHWIMGDGTESMGGLVLCTDNFTLEEVAKLRALLLANFGLTNTLVMHGKTSANANGNPRIRIPKHEMPKLRAIVTPHMLPTFMYKLSVFN